MHINDQDTIHTFDLDRLYSEFQGTQKGKQLKMNNSTFYREVDNYLHCLIFSRETNGTVRIEKQTRLACTEG